MSTLDFIPHSLKRKKVGVDKSSLAFEAPTSTRPSSSQPKIIPATTEETTPMAPPKSKDKPQKKKEKQFIKPSWEFAFLVWLALSDYSLWADGDLRRRIDTSENVLGGADAREDNSTVNMVDGGSMCVGEKESRDTPDEQGYIPLDHLFKKGEVFRLVSNLQPYCNAKEITYVNALRQFAKDEIDVRFIVNSESSSMRATMTSRRTRKPQSGYEARRTDFASLKESESSQYSKSRWDALTLYMENIPKQYAKVSGIGKLVTAILPASTNSPMKRVQNIVFPPHHQDLPDSIPICKGFALITLSSEDDVQALLNAWPWDSEKRVDSHDSTQVKQDGMTLNKKADNRNAEESSAKFSGLRVCTKARWEDLRAEYLLYRHQLVDEINQNQDEGEARRQKANMNGGPPMSEKEVAAASGSKRKQPESTAQNEVGSGIHPDSPYPTACLVFVRHVHPETNKMTLRTLFSRAWATEIDNAIDYIDYSKNTDSCYVRFGTPAHAECFVNYFSSHQIAQQSGLDSIGSESSEVQSIMTEIVLGTREEVYWDKIPEKLRRQAVEKTLRAMRGPQSVGDFSGVGETQEGEGSDRKKRRRKRKASE